MPSISHPDLICQLSSLRGIASPAQDIAGSKEQTWCAVRAAAEDIPQSERLERLRRLRSLIVDAHDVRDSGHVYDLGNRLSELELGHNFRADSRYVSELPMEIAYIHFGYSPHMEFGNGRWFDGVYIRQIADERGEGMLFTFVGNNLATKPTAPTSDLLCEASNCVSAFVPADEDPRRVLHRAASYRGEPMLAKTLRIVSAAEIAVYGLSMLSPLRPIAKSWIP